ncbi:MAG: arginine repressor [Ferrimicrobium sp.]|uniref:arginine repressor n=1 Tax=Ferrimicrobium sp. TaxID=2926050 RepID=UPI00260DD5A5|nr:arginine repressor [Ferrimicrobium sp.]
MAKNQRQYRIAKLISQAPISAQQQLVDMLAEEGITATQATVSRDLDELGAIKVKGPGGASIYAIPDLPRDQISTEGYLKRVLGEWVVEVVNSGDLVMLKTPPGCAHVVASALDRTRPDGVLGTVAGDDTVLVLADLPMGGDHLAKLMREVAGLPG